MRCTRGRDRFAVRPRRKHRCGFFHDGGGLPDLVAPSERLLWDRRRLLATVPKTRASWRRFFVRCHPENRKSVIIDAVAHCKRGSLDRVSTRRVNPCDQPNSMGRVQRTSAEPDAWTRGNNSPLQKILDLGSSSQSIPTLRSREGFFAAAIKVPAAWDQLGGH